MVFGNYYCYDIPAALNVPLRDWLGSDYNTFQWQLNLLYTVYSLPNVFLPLLGGYLVDRLGSSRMIIIFSTTIMLGATLFSFGISTRSFWLMLVGRVMFGLGGESLEVASATVVTDWFKGRGLALAFGINLSSARIATSSQDNLSPLIAGASSAPYAAWFGFVLCILSFVCGLVLIQMDKPLSRIRAGVEVNENHADFDQSGFLISDKSEEVDMHASEPVTDDEEEGDDEEYESEGIDCAQLASFPSSFWLICLTTIALYGSVVPFVHISSDFLQSKWFPGDAQTAGALMSIPDVISAVGSPLFGFLVDRVGHRGHLLPVAGILICTVHILLNFTSMHPILPLVLLGLSYALFCAVIWPCIPYLVRPNQVGTSYGFVTVSLNLSLAIFPLIVAHVRSNAEDFTSVGVLMICISLTGTVLALILNVLDARNGSILQKVHSSKDEENDEDEVEDDDEAYVSPVVVGEGLLLQVPHHGHPIHGRRHSQGHYHMVRGRGKSVDVRGDKLKLNPVLNGASGSGDKQVSDQMAAEDEAKGGKYWNGSAFSWDGGLNQIE